MLEVHGGSALFGDSVGDKDLQSWRLRGDRGSCAGGKKHRRELGVHGGSNFTVGGVGGVGGGCRISGDGKAIRNKAGEGRITCVEFFSREIQVKCYQRSKERGHLRIRGKVRKTAEKAGVEKGRREGGKESSGGASKGKGV